MEIEGMKAAVRESLKRHYEGEVTDEMVRNCLPLFISGIKYGLKLADAAVKAGLDEARVASVTRAPKPESDEVLDAEIIG